MSVRAFLSLRQIAVTSAMVVYFTPLASCNADTLSQGRDITIADPSNPILDRDIHLHIEHAGIINRSDVSKRRYGYAFFFESTSDKVTNLPSKSQNGGSHDAANPVVLVKIENVTTKIHAFKSIFKVAEATLDFDRKHLTDGVATEIGITSQGDQYIKINFLNGSKETINYTQEFVNASIKNTTLAERVEFCQFSNSGRSCEMQMRLNCEPNLEITVSMLPPSQEEAIATGIDLKVMTEVSSWLPHCTQIN